MRGCSGNNRIIQTIVMIVHVLKSLLSLVIVAHHLKDSLAQSDLTGERERDALLLLGLLLADLPREGEETGDRDLDSDLQKVPETKFIT